MNTRHFLLLLVLAALWGASFLFIRVATQEFGPVPLMTVRIAIAALFLVVMLSYQRGFGKLSGKLLPVVGVGVINQSLPFCLLAYAQLTLPAGVTSVINATTPLWAALVAFMWLGDRLSFLRITGLLVGFVGVLILVWKDLRGLHTFNESALAPLAALCATLSYGIAANFTKKYLTGVDPYAVATGSMVGALLVLLPFAAISCRGARHCLHRDCLRYLLLFDRRNRTGARCFRYLSRAGLRHYVGRPVS
jgi:drug/metabolite transporter (DMT)-like permease